MMVRQQLGLEQYDQFIRELHDGKRQPFPWQVELVRRMFSGEWPDTISVPTGTGKTSVIHAAVYSLAAGCSSLRRIFFAVDRRVIVEEAYHTARQLAEKLASATSATPVLYEVAARLREVGGLDPADPNPLQVFQLRGGIYREKAWARSPLQPVVVTTTVDQLGSRLLYRGYGASSRAWALQAGLVGNDSLLVLDEAHCSNPFRQTLAAIANFRRWGDNNPGRASHFIYMSATPGESTSNPPLTLLPEDYHPSQLGPRLTASKEAQLIVVDGKGPDKLADELVRLALSLEADPGVKSVGILVNRVDTARRVQGKLKNRLAIKLTGRMREPDRKRLFEEFGKYLRASAEKERPDECLFTVATQCIEVGANIDFDALVTECSSLDSLRQRFGRLDRLGLRRSSSAFIVMQSENLQPKDPDPVYGDALPNTWKWLNGVAENGVVDFGIEALRAKLPSDSELADLQLSMPNAPVLLPAYLDRWVQTSPPPQPDPDPGVFLRGTQVSRPDVAVLWRADVRADMADPETPDKETADLLSAQPPAMGETAPVPMGQFLRWLAGKEIDLRRDSDIEGTVEAEDETDLATAGRQAFLWRGPDDDASRWIEYKDRRLLRPGDVLVIPAFDLSSHKLADFPEDRRRAWDLGDLIQAQARRRCAFRLDLDLLSLWKGPDDALTEWCVRAEEFLRAEFDPGEAEDKLCELLVDFPEVEELRGLRAMVDHWLQKKKDRVFTGLAKPRSWLLSTRRKMHPENVADANGDYTLSDDTSSVSARPVPLRKHCEGVAARARQFAEKCGLDPRYAELLGLAGELHDVGKCDPRFQAWLFGGNELAFRATQELWAKSDRNRTQKQRDRARERSGYPRGGRHELVSARIVSDTPELWRGCVDPDLLIHLVASHHGHARPFSPWIEDFGNLQTESYVHQGNALSGPVRSGFEHLQSGQPERFWRLVRRYGWWGLAWFESLLMLADHLESESEKEEAASD